MATVLEDVGKQTIDHLGYVGSLNIQLWSTLSAMKSALPLVGGFDRLTTHNRRSASGYFLFVTAKHAKPCFRQPGLNSALFVIQARGLQCYNPAGRIGRRYSA